MDKPANHQYYNNYSPESHKIGVSNISDVAETIYEYKSSVLKEQNSASESVLLILYKYRKNSF